MRGDWTRNPDDYPKAMRIDRLESCMEEATGMLKDLIQASEEYPEQIERCDPRIRQEFQATLWKAAKPR